MPDRPSNLVRPGAQLGWISIYETVIPIEALSPVAEIREGRDGRSQVISRDSAALDGVLKMFQNSSTLLGPVVFDVGDIATVTADSLLVEADAVLTARPRSRRRDACMRPDPPWDPASTPMRSAAG